ncbi:MAG: hypothetical protein HY741_09095 [Chloroflexi bacterium]|nr:hypothetical protein [Chloroflexota bacterium]
MDIYQALDKINNDEELDLGQIEKGGSFAAKVIEDRRFLCSLNEAWGHSVRKGGTVSGDFLPLTVGILNIDESPAKRVYFGKDAWVVVYYGISPELENFVTVVLWPSHSESSKKTYRQIVDILQAKNKVLLFEGKYALNPPNEIHPAWASTISSAEQQSTFYDWKFYPFLKEIGDTLLDFGSAANYRKVFLRDNHDEIREEYINTRAVVGVILDKRPGEVLLKTPHIETKHRVFWFKVPVQSLSREIQTGRAYCMLVLQKPIAEETEIIQVQPAGDHDFIAHIIAYRLYHHYLKQAGLIVASEREYTSLFQEAGKIATATLGHLSKYDPRILNPQFLFQYLQPFFQLIDGNVYYVPKILPPVQAEIVAFDRMLQALGRYGQGFGKRDFLPKRVVSQRWTMHNTVQFLKCQSQFLVNREKICQVNKPS